MVLIGVGIILILCAGSSLTAAVDMVYATTGVTIGIGLIMIGLRQVKK